MKKSKLFSFFGEKKPIIGMVHLHALPGSPLYNGTSSWNDILSYAVEDALNLKEGGIDGIQIENQFDTPYLLPDKIGPETIAFLTAAACIIREKCPDISLGINVHLNGSIQAMAVAKAAGAKWIRVFNLATGYISNSGYVDANGPSLMRYRKQIDAEDIMVFGDFQVKHGSHAITADRSLQEKAHDIQMSLADAAIITGSATGIAPGEKLLQEVNHAISIPLLVGSGVSIDNIERIWPLVDGAIIGSGFKRNGNLMAPIDVDLVKKLTSMASKLA